MSDCFCDTCKYEDASVTEEPCGSCLYDENCSGYVPKIPLARIENPRPAWWESQIYHFWGDRLPLNFCEEAGELMQAISKMERGIGDAETVLKEMADVYICMGGLAKRYGFGMADVEYWVSQKLLEEKEN